jgi:MFS family permease
MTTMPSSAPAVNTQSDRLRIGVQTRSSSPASGAPRQLAWLSLAMFLGMTLWFSATAATAPIVAEFRLTPGDAAWLTMAVQAGFVIGTLISALLTLPDVINPRHLFGIGCIVGAAANALLIFADGAVALIALRMITGIALACVYPPGMKVAAGWFERRRGAALGILIGALTIGSAFPHLLAAAAARIPWRTLMLAASALALGGSAVVVRLVGDGPFVATTARFDRRAVAQVFANRGTRLATLGYLGHMWELYAMWTWIAAFATASLLPLSRGGAAPASRAGSAMAFLTIGSGAIGSAAAGWWADAFGKARIARWAMIVSGLCAAASGLVFGAPAWVLALFAIVWGVAVVADSAQLSALVAQYSPRDHVGTALTIQTCLGFLLTMASIRLVPVMARTTGWQWVFLLLVPGPALGAFALATLDDRGIARQD